MLQAELPAALQTVHSLSPEFAREMYQETGFLLWETGWGLDDFLRFVCPMGCEEIFSNSKSLN